MIYTEQTRKDSLLKGRFEEMELHVLDEGKYENYKRIGSKEIDDSWRYSMAIAYAAVENAGHDSVAFIGGIGVLGNLVNVLGESIIPQWRGTEDVDVLVRDRKYEGVITGAFDSIAAYGPSLSIPNKSVLKGEAYDSENTALRPIDVDIYHPNGNPQHGIHLDGKIIDDKSWNRSLSVDFFGIPVRVLNPLELLNLKLSIVCQRNNVPRDKDIQDIYHLIGVAQKLGYSPEQILGDLSKKSRNTLRRISTEFYHNCFTPLINANLNPFGGLI